MNNERAFYMTRAVVDLSWLWIALGLEYNQVVELSFNHRALFSTLGRAYVLCHNIKWRAKILREVFRRRPSLRL
jgi:hypothetical protein